MDNKKRKTMCLNCECSYRDKVRVLRCHKGHTTSVTNYDCEDYVVFLEDKEDLYKMYKVVENLTKHNSRIIQSALTKKEKSAVKKIFNHNFKDASAD